MSVKVIGDKALERELEKRFGIKEMVKVQDKALIAGAKVIVEEVKKQLKPSKDTGALINEVSFSKPEWINGKRTITVHWRGSKDRYKIVHLIEYGHVQKGTGKFIKPKAMGGGDLVGGILDPDKINYHYGRTAAYTAATGRPFHEGVDFPFVYQEVRTPMGGRLTRMPFMSGGYGNYVKITSGVIDMLFAHLKNFSKSPPSGTMVKPGDVVGLTGNTGFSTGPHLHFEMRRNGRHFDPEPYLRNAKKKGRLSIGGGGATSGSGATYASRVIRQAQSILGGRYKGKWIHDQMMRVAKRESNYQSNAVNNWDINAQRGDPSRGLFQIIGSTFRANAKRGYTNFNNPVHQGISAMQYIVRRYGWDGFKRAGDYAYATGGKVFDGWYNLGEDGHPEWVIPTDPARRNDAMKMLHYAAAEVRGKNASKNK